MRHRHSLGLLFAGGLIVTSFYGCGDDTSETVPPGTGGGGDGGTTAVTVTGGVVSSSTGGPAPTQLGAACNDDAACATLGEMGLTCILPTDNSMAFGGGAVNGYCTMACATDGDCPGTGSACVSGECYLGCTIGPDLQFIDGMLDPMKCHGRQYVACRQLNAGDVCVPTCGDDSQCAGRECDPMSGQCVDTKNPGKLNGEPCSGSNDTSCAGFCQGFTNINQDICSQGCSLGGDLMGLDCGGGLNAGLCIYRPTGYGEGDYGRCAAFCDVHDRCANPEWWCFNNGSFAPEGYCFSADDCPNGDSDCMGQGSDNRACVPTPFGDKCLQYDPNNCTGNGGFGPNGCALRFPLTLGGGGAGGTGGAGGAGGTGGTGGN